MNNIHIICRGMRINVVFTLAVCSWNKHSNISWRPSERWMVHVRGSGWDGGFQCLKIPQRPILDSRRQHDQRVAGSSFRAMQFVPGLHIPPSRIFSKGVQRPMPRHSGPIPGHGWTGARDFRRRKNRAHAISRTEIENDVH